jgi:hypothetical protein
MYINLAYYIGIVMALALGLRDTADLFSVKR